MSTWAARAKAAISQKGLCGTAKTDENPVFGLSSVSSVPTEAVCQTPDRLLSVLAVPTPPVFEKRDVEPAAANDPAPAPTTTVQAVIAESVNKLIDIGTVRPPGLSPLLLAASLALDASISAAGTLPGNDPEADCWPRSAAMNGAEIDLFTARLHRFTDKGLTRTDGEVLADKLVIRDRETDDRWSCLECRHLSGYGHTSWRCGNWQTAGVAIRPRDTQLPAELVLQLQRCDGFATATPNAKANATPNSIAKTPF
jgi:hypothetical protein